MDATTDQIKREIEEARERISETTSELGERIRATFDWRQQVGEHPFAAAGLAAGTGFLLGTMTARLMGRGRAAADYGEPYAYDRIGRAVEAEPSGPEARGMGWLRGAAAAGTGWLAGRREGSHQAAETAAPRAEGAGAPPAAERQPERRQERREPGGMGRPGAVAGLLAGLGATFQPQLQEIGRNLAEQLKDLSNHLIGQGKDAMKQRVDEWRSRSRPGGRPGDQGTASQASGGSTLSSESAGAWSSGSRTGGQPPGGPAGSAGASQTGGPAGSETEPITGSATSPGVVDTRETRTPQSRESAGTERRIGGS